MKKILLSVIAMVFAAININAGTVSVDFSQFGDGVDATGATAIEQNGFSFVGNNSKVTLTKSGFYTGGSTTSTARYVSYTPASDGTLTVTATPSGSSERYVGICTTPMAPKVDAEGVVAATLMDKKDSVVEVQALLTAGTTYYICLNGNGTVTAISFATLPPTFNISASSYVGSSYEGKAVEAPLTDILAAINATSMNDVTIYSEEPNGTRTASVRGETDGWRDADGLFAYWATDACAFYVQDDADLPGAKYYVGGYPGRTDSIISYSAKLVYVNNTTADEAVLNVTLSYIPAPKVELKVVSTVSASVEYSYTDDWYTEKVVSLNDYQVSTIKTKLGLTSLDEATPYGYNPTTKEIVTSYVNYDGWRDLNGDFANWTGDPTTVPFCVKYENGKDYYCYNLMHGTATADCYWAIANSNNEAVLVKISFKYTIPDVTANIYAEDNTVAKLYRDSVGDNTHVVLYQGKQAYTTKANENVIVFVPEAGKDLVVTVNADTIQADTLGYFTIEIEDGDSIVVAAVAAPAPAEDDLTTDMFHHWSGVDATATVTEDKPYCNGDGLNVSTQMVYGNSNVSELEYADLSAYSKLVITTTEGAPRCLFNRLVKDGAAPDNLIDCGNNDDQRAAYMTEESGVYTIDLAKIVADKGFAHLLCIKGAKWANVTVTSMKLVKADTPTAVKTVSAAKTIAANGKYLVNGKLVIVKNGKQYYANGMMVK